MLRSFKERRGKIKFLKIVFGIILKIVYEIFFVLFLLFVILVSVEVVCIFDRYDYKKDFFWGEFYFFVIILCFFLFCEYSFMYNVKLIICFVY